MWRTACGNTALFLPHEGCAAYFCFSGARDLSLGKIPHGIRVEKSVPVPRRYAETFGTVLWKSWQPDGYTQNRPYTFPDISQEKRADAKRFFTEASSFFHKTFPQDCGKVVPFHTIFHRLWTNPKKSAEFSEKSCEKAVDRSGFSHTPCLHTLDLFDHFLNFRTVHRVL